MPESISIILNFVAQFTGGRGGIDHVIVNYAIAAFFWAVLTFVARLNYVDTRAPRELYLFWGFGIAFSREAFMVVMAVFQAFGIFDHDVLHEFFPPLEHTLNDISLAVIGAAFLRYLLDDYRVAQRYLLLALGVTIIAYLSTFSWWADYIRNNPTSKFGQTWADWVFHINRTWWATAAAVILWYRTSGWVRNSAVTAFLFFAIHSFLKIPDMMLDEVYEGIFTPIRRSFYLLGIPIFGYVYLREQWERRKEAEDNLKSTLAGLELTVQQRTMELESSARLTNAILESANDAIIAFNGHGNILRCNPITEKLFGYSTEELNGNSVQLFSPKDTSAQGFFSKLQNEFGSEITGIYHDESFLRRDGKLMPIRVSVSEVVQEDTVNYSAILHDLTEQNKLDQAKSDFVSVISHELRTPLTSIKGSLEMLSAGVLGKLPQSAAQLIDIAAVNSRRLSLLIDDILHLDKLESGEFNLQIERHNLGPLIENSIKEVSGFADKYNVSLNFIDANKKDLYANISDERFMQVMANLLSNAIKFSLEKNRVDIFAERYNDTVRVSVRDYGEGIPDSFKSEIYKKFSQVDITTLRRQAGSGLGLNITKSLVEKMRGSISFDSEVGVGTTFHVDFPAS